jgi:hypothetical protein
MATAEPGLGFIFPSDTGLERMLDAVMHEIREREDAETRKAVMAWLNDGVQRIIHGYIWFVDDAVHTAYITVIDEGSESFLPATWHHHAFGELPPATADEAGL